MSICMFSYYLDIMERSVPSSVQDTQLKRGKFGSVVDMATVLRMNLMNGNANVIMGTRDACLNYF